MKTKAILLSAGKGTRMNQSVSKQYLMLGNQTILSYSLEQFQKSSIDEIILVTAQEDIEYVKNNIVLPHKINKVTKIVAGGQERYLSVYQGLLAAQNCDYVMIHDGARPFVSQNIIERTLSAVWEYKACVVGMPVKDTIKIIDEHGYAKETPDRSHVWMVQTPQAFSYPLIFDAYSRMLMREDSGITDDAMVVERMTDYKVKLIEGSYQNIKITTPEDLDIAEVYLGK